MNKPLISIIVPVYKVEKYLAECIDSILAQTFKDYELILVDDGSPDNCPKMCDEYAAKYDFIKVIHKENGGLSDARNFGIDWAINNSDSKYLLFVDSDDIIKKNLLKKTFKIAEKKNADIVCFGIDMTDEKLNILEWGTMRIKKNTSFDYPDRFAPIVPPYFIGDYAVNKLWRKELFKSGKRYPKGKTFEDVYTTYKLFDEANRIFLYKKNLYIYRRNSGSITQSKNNNINNENKFSFYYSTKEKYDYILKQCPDYREKAITCLINAISVLYKKDDEEKIFLEWKYFIENNKNLIFDNEYIKSEQLKICEEILSI